MIDAIKGFIKDGAKNRLREQDIHKIVDAFTKLAELPRYSRMVPLTEIADPKNDYNLNLPRYIDSTEPEDIQDIDGHLRGGIPGVTWMRCATIEGDPRCAQCPVRVSRDPQAFSLFVERVEEAIAIENSATLNVMTMANETIDSTKHAKPGGLTRSSSRRLTARLFKR